MKRRKMSVLLLLMLVVLLAGCKEKKDVKLVEDAENTTEIKFSKISDEQATEVEQIFLVMLPEEGKIDYYDVQLNTNDLGHFYAEIEFADKYYDELLGEIGKTYHEETFDMNCYIPEDIFETKREEIHVAFQSVRGKVILDGEKEITRSSYYRIYVTKPADGAFKVLFVTSNC